ncbi:mycothiol system anti-sigma-R factor [Corynebacterium sp. TA-R-1]|uniref:Mycothiol system anti-sigma-R factor n=1 Tax=Corynebacterium stercoris TaxID=2943490 RepID=A0ABT1G1Q2_9CORY|nr:mycothiol system anti-sigma-R factor [Corynebacterium stercoris]MCP1387954.1 mycothiol system anti-sigma-R factor [Corynebacterium stercoris]
MGAGDCTCGNRGEHSTHQLLCELFDSDTSPARAAEIRAELGACPHCMSKLKSEQDVRGLVRDCCGEAHAPEPLRQRIITSITTVSYTEIRYR